LKGKKNKEVKKKRKKLKNEISNLLYTVFLFSPLYSRIITEAKSYIGWLVFLKSCGRIH